MPLIVQGTIVDENDFSFKKIVEMFPDLKERAKKFCSTPVQEVPSSGLLYVIQREFVTVAPSDDNVTIIGSEDATTCHIVILRNQDTGVTCLTHFDGIGMKEALVKIIKAVTGLQSADNYFHQKIDLHVFGGFLDDKGKSAEISNEILAFIRHQSIRVNLCTACITDLNDVEQEGQHRPIVYGVGINVKTGEIFRATFPDKGPDGSLRHARNFTGCKEVIQVYDSSVGEIRIGPFDYKPWECAPIFLQAPDHVILQYLSTSPHCEPAGFCDETRTTMKFITDNPSPLKTVFPDGMPHRYVRKGCKWERV